VHRIPAPIHGGPGCRFRGLKNVKTIERENVDILRYHEIPCLTNDAGLKQ